VEVTQLGIYQNMLDAREKVLKSDKANKEAEVDQINGVIQFWTSMASLAEGKFGSAMKLAKGETAGKIEGRVGNVLAKRRADKQYDEAAKLAQEGKGAAQQRLYLDRAEQAREFASEAPESMEISVGEVVGKLVEWHYEEQLSELKSQIVSLEKQIGAVDATQDLAKAEARIKDYADARKALSDIAKQIKNTALAERERNYLDAGESLDRYARAHASQLKHEGKGSLAPKSDKQEIYSTLMVIVGKIRAYLLLSDKARETFAYDDFVSKALQLDAERREPWKAAELAAAAGDGFWVPPRLPQTSKKENERVWEKIDGVYAHVFKDFDKARIQFEDAVTKMTTLFQSMKGVKSKEGDSPENQY
jgi:hypothetical protein